MLRHLVRYMAGTTDYGLLFPRLENARDSESEKGQGSARSLLRTRQDLLAWSNADWARDLTNQRSQREFVFTLNSGPILWCSCLQLATANSTTEAEFATLHVCVRDVGWICNVVSEIGLLPTA